MLSQSAYQVANKATCCFMLKEAAVVSKRRHQAMLTSIRQIGTNAIRKSGASFLSSGAIRRSVLPGIVQSSYSLQTFNNQVVAKRFNGSEKSDSSSQRIFSSVAVGVDCDGGNSSDHEEGTPSESSKSRITKEEVLGNVDMDELRALASSNLTPLSLTDMFKYGRGTDMAQRLRNAQFLHSELQRRIAQRAVDLLTLPHGLSHAEPILEVAQVYINYLKQIKECPLPTTYKQEDEFTNMLQKMVLDRKSIPTAIARGMEEWIDVRKEHLELDRLQQMEAALYRFFTARVGLRFLTEHHCLSSPHEDRTREFRRAKHQLVDEEEFQQSGCIQTNCDPKKEIIKVAKKVARQTKDYYGICPEIDIVDCVSAEARDFTYVPHHLRYMVAELLKNSCRATVKNYLKKGGKENSDAELPNIRVVVVKGREDVTIKVCDKGGGIPRSDMSTIWKFAHSTAEKEENSADFGTDEVTGTQIRGFGLPLARIYARYFGGELTLKSMEGYGLDAYLHLPRLGDACENLPKRVTTSPGALDSTPTRGTRMYSTQRTNNNNMDNSRQTIIIGDPLRESLDDTVEHAKVTRVLKILRDRSL